MFAKTLLLGALAALAAAQSTVLTFTRVPNPITDGEPQAITYATNDTVTPVTITLRKGASSNLQTVDVLTKAATGGQFVWTPPLSLANGADYALEIRQNDQVNYFGPLTIQGASPASVSASAAATANSTMTSMSMTGSAASMGTGTMMSRNTTMSKPTLKHTGTGMGTKPTNTNTMGGGSPTMQSTGSMSSPTNTGAANSDFTASSSFALAFGALAAIFYLH